MTNADPEFNLALSKSTKNERPTKPRLQGSALKLGNASPWPAPVEGAALLDDIVAQLDRFCVLPENTSAAIALWVVHTHCVKAFPISPRLAITSPQKGCGKSTLLDVLELLCASPLMASNLTGAALFRVIESHGPTLLIDEADTFLSDKSDLEGVLNAGHRVNGSVLRVVGDSHEPRVFSVFAPVAIACIGAIRSAALNDRCIPVEMMRKTARDQVDRLRPHKPNLCAPLPQLQRQCARWADDNMESLSCYDPEIPTVLENRAGDNWRVLIAIADQAGGAWPQFARDIAQRLAGTSRDNDEDTKTMLLEDIRLAFSEQPEERLRTADLLNALYDMENRPWNEWRGGKPITPAQLARMLKPYHIRPRQIKQGYKNNNGYARADFDDAFARYLPTKAS